MTNNVEIESLPRWYIWWRDLVFCADGLLAIFAFSDINFFATFVMKLLAMNENLGEIVNSAPDNRVILLLAVLLMTPPLLISGFVINFRLRSHPDQSQAASWQDMVLVSLSTVAVLILAFLLWVLGDKGG